MFSNIGSINTILISLSTVMSVFLHDMRLDRIAVSLPVDSLYNIGHVNKSGGFFDMVHTHVERLSLLNVSEESRNSSPKMQPRLTENKRHLIQKRVMKGYHPFDGYNIQRHNTI